VSKLARLVFFVLATIFCVYALLYLGVRSAIRQDSTYHFLIGSRTLWRSPIELEVVETTSETTPLNLGASPLFNEHDQLVYAPDRLPVLPPRITTKTMVLFTFGQSNAANFLTTRHDSYEGKVYNFFAGRYYVAKDPLLGSDGTAGSLWTLLGNKLVDSGVADRVIVVANGRSGSPIRLWQPEQPLGVHLSFRLSQLVSQGLPVTHFLWQQGESDFDTDATQYENDLQSVIDITKRYFPQSQFYVAQSVRCGYKARTSEVPDAQRQATKRDGVYLGPDSDQIGIDGRQHPDQCHLNGLGQELLASWWLTSIRENIPAATK